MKEMFYLILFSVFITGGFLVWILNKDTKINLVPEKLISPWTGNHEIEEILKSTPYLWRPSLMKHDTVGSLPWDRIEEQRRWTRRIANTTYFKNAKPLTLFVEYPQNYYYVPRNNVCKGFISGWESKCRIIWAKSEESHLLQQELKDLVASGTRVHAVVTVRNTRNRSNYKVPLGIRQIMYLREAPHKTIQGVLSYNDALLASYDLAVSDIPAPYFEYVSVVDEMKSLQFLEPLDPKSKTKLALALISNCQSKTRLRIVNELQKYMKLNVFGRCGKRLDNCFLNDTTCPQKLAKEYKFFLAFENANCRHYITEKFFRNALMYGMVPIVIGAHAEDYRLIAPPHSYIHAEEFPSLKGLAEYINILDGNDTLYASYLVWRNKGTISNAPSKDIFCRICGMLHYSQFVPPPSWKSQGNGTIYWKNINSCLKRDKWKWLTN